MDMTWNAKKRHFVLERDLPAGKFPFKLLYGDHWTTSADHPTLKVPSVIAPLYFKSHLLNWNHPLSTCLNLATIKETKTDSWSKVSLCKIYQKICICSDPYMLVGKGSDCSGLFNCLNCHQCWVMNAFRRRLAAIQFGFAGWRYHQQLLGSCE